MLNISDLRFYKGKLVSHVVNGPNKLNMDKAITKFNLMKQSCGDNKTKVNDLLKELSFKHFVD